MGETRPAVASRRRAAMIGGGLAVAVAGIGGALAFGAFDRDPPARDEPPPPLAKPDPSMVPSLAEKPPAPEPRLAAHDVVPTDELDYRGETGAIRRDEPKPPEVPRTADRRGRVPTVAIGEPGTAVDLDKAIIRRYIKRNTRKISDCYEQTLVDNPSLDGKITAEFHIDSEGRVTHATASGLDPGVASCVAGVIKGIQFPKPTGGGGVQVTYPFNFHRAG